jgi:ATP-dependent RNA helicase DDX46/PRP5
LSEAQKLARFEKREALIEAGMLDADEEDPLLKEISKSAESVENITEPDYNVAVDLQSKLSADILALPGMQQAILKKAGIIHDIGDVDDPSLGRPVQTGPDHFVQEFEINDYPREARWKVTQKETTSRLQDEFQTAVTLKGEYFGPGREPEEGQRRLYLHLEATSERILANCVVEIRRLLNEETLRVGARGLSGSSHKYSVFSK